MSQSNPFANLNSFINFMSVGEIDVTNIEGHIVRKLSDLIKSNVQCSFLCPMLTGKGADLYITYKTNTAPYAEYIGGKELEELERKKGLVRIVKVDMRSGNNNAAPIMIFSLDTTISQEDLLLLDDLVNEIFVKIFRECFAKIRRAIIFANSNSNDINSFIYKVFRHPNNLLRLIGAEAGSIFLRSPESSMIRLRGTTGLAEIERHWSEVSFHIDENTNVGQVYKSGNILVQHGGAYPVVEGSSAEQVEAGISSKYYGPIRLRDLSISQNHMKTSNKPIGVFRVVNSIFSQKRNLPFSWIYFEIFEYTSESLFNILDSYFAAEEESFKKEEAYHGASSAVDTIAKNIDFVRRYIFSDIKPEDETIKPQLFLKPIENFRTEGVEEVKILLNTAFAAARSLSYQIERANAELPASKSDVTNRIIVDVILRAAGTIQDRCIMYSAKEYVDIQSSGELLAASGYPPPVRGSPEALTSVFANLYENSVKYRKIGTPIKIELSFERSDGYLIVSFRDFGIGITRGEEERIFDRGYRTDEAKDHIVSGGGLGLAWCRDVIDHFGGEIHAEALNDGLLIVVKLEIAD